MEGIEGPRQKPGSVRRGGDGNQVREAWHDRFPKRTGIVRVVHWRLIRGGNEVGSVCRRCERGAIGGGDTGWNPGGARVCRSVDWTIRGGGDVYDVPSRDGDEFVAVGGRTERRPIG